MVDRPAGTNARRGLPALARIAAACGFLAGVISACERPEPMGPAVVLYSSVDDHFLREVVAAYEAESGVDVQVVGDTEATKTTGLVQRLIAERENPRADVWWSSEALGTIKLADEKLLQPYEPGSIDGWPEGLRGEDNLWHGLASRARVFVYNTARLAEADVPRTLAALTAPKWRGRVGMARPQFGTTRSQMAALLADAGPEAYRTWLEAMEANGLRLYDGNATIVRAVAQGEIDIGLTDTDDVWAGQRNRWPVAMVFEATDPGASPPSRGPLLMPNTVAMVRGAPHPDQAGPLIDFILSEQTERLLAESESRNLPARPELAAQFPQNAVPDPWVVDWRAVAAAGPEAVRIAEEVLGN